MKWENVHELQLLWYVEKKINFFFVRANKNSLLLNEILAFSPFQQALTEADGGIKVLTMSWINFLFYMLCIIVRPSMEKKSCAKSYLNKGN